MTPRPPPGAPPSRVLALAAGLAVGLAVAPALAACTPAGAGVGRGRGGEVTSAAGGAAARGTVVVLAAASLTEAFDRVTAEFEAAHPGVVVRVSYGSSATFVQQVNNGAPADVLALAGEAAARPLDASLLRGEALFASNVLAVAVPPGNPARVTGLSDLGRPGLKVVLCAAPVPCGAAADAVFAKAGVTPSVVSREVDVKATLAKVRLGEADAAVVYASDVASARRAVTGIPIPPAQNVTLRYPILRLSDDPATRAYVDFVASARARPAIQSFGFGPP